MLNFPKTLIFFLVWKPTETKHDSKLKIPLSFPPFYQEPNREYEENKGTEKNTGLVSTTTAAGVEDARSFAAKTKLTVGGENKGLKKGSLGSPS